MNFWQENKPFVIIIGVAVVALFFLWPSLFDLGPSIVSLDRGAYDQAELERRKLKSTLEVYYNPKGNKIPVKVASAVVDIKQANDLLLTNFEEMHRWMSFVPRFPFRIPEVRTGSERPAYDSLAYTYIQTGELYSNVPGRKEYEIREPYDGICFIASARGIKIGDPTFGMHGMQDVASIKDADICIMQLGLLHDLGHLAIRVGVDEIISMSPAEPYTWAVKGTEVAKAFPINLHFSSDLPTLLALLHGLDGAHGRVVEVAASAEEPPPAPAAANPRPIEAAAAKAEPKADLKAEPKAEVKAEAKAEVKAEAKEAPKAEAKEAAKAEAKEAAKAEAKEAAKPEAKEDLKAGPKEEAKEERPAPEPRDAAAPKIIIQIKGKPSLYFPTAEQAGLKERLTIFRPSETDPHDLKFVANAIVTRSLGDDRVEAVIEPLSDVIFAADGKTTRNVVRRGDFASTRFFLVRGLKIKVVDAKVEKDKDGFPADVVPAHLEIELSAAALQFLKPETPKVTVEATPAAVEPAPPKPTHKRI